MQQAAGAGSFLGLFRPSDAKSEHIQGEPNMLLPKL